MEFPTTTQRFAWVAQEISLIFVVIDKTVSNFLSMSRTKVLFRQKIPEIVPMFRSFWPPWHSSAFSIFICLCRLGYLALSFLKTFAGFEEKLRR